MAVPDRLGRQLAGHLGCSQWMGKAAETKVAEPTLAPGLNESRATHHGVCAATQTTTRHLPPVPPTELRTRAGCQFTRLADYPSALGCRALPATKRWRRDLPRPFRVALHRAGRVGEAIVERLHELVGHFPNHVDALACATPPAHWPRTQDTAPEACVL